MIIKWKRIKIFIVICLFVIASMGLCKRNVQAASAKEKALKAYSRFLQKDSLIRGMEKVPLRKCSFALIYFDKDKIPELVICSKGLHSHVSGGYYELYTYKKGKVVCIADLGDEAFYYKRKGVYCNTYYSPYFMPGIIVTSYEQYPAKKGKPYLTMIEDIEDIIGDKKIVTATEYYQGGMTISKKTFQKQLKKMVGSAKRTKVKKFYRNTMKNRRKYLK